jgi:hypothetical protein
MRNQAKLNLIHLVEECTTLGNHDLQAKGNTMQMQVWLI